MLQPYFKSLYDRTMAEAYGLAHREIHASLANGGACLDCGAGTGHKLRQLGEEIGLTRERYFGLEWQAEQANEAVRLGANVRRHDLNHELPYEDGKFRCIFALSVVEHLLYPCRFMRECFRCLGAGGQAVILTPNISTAFTAALIVAGKMPSSGPHPDSELLLGHETPFRVSSDATVSDASSDTPAHRHLVVFSYRVLKSYLELLGFESIRGYGFGWYPFPNFMQPLLEKVDPWHCHQLVFVATRPDSGG